MTDADPLQPRDAERAVLGSLILRPDLFDRIQLRLRPEDFGSMVYQQLARLLYGMFSRNELVDPQLVLAKAMEPQPTLDTRIPQSDVGKVVHDCIRAAWSPIAIEHYADIVLTASRRRSLKQIGQTLMRRADDGDPDVASIEGMDELERLTERRSVDTTPSPSAEYLNSVQIHEDFIFPDLLERSDRMLIPGFEGGGKLLRVDTPLPTVSGWTTMGEIQVGSRVFGSDGKPCRVVAVSEVEPNPDAYAVTFSDGAVIEADARHQWLTETLAAREAESRFRRRGPDRPRGSDQRHKRVHFPAVVTTEQIRDTLVARDDHTLNHTIRVAGPLDLPDADLPIPPFTLGVWAGDGTTRTGALTLNRDDADEIEARIRAEGLETHRVPSGERPGSVTIRLPGFTKQLAGAGLLGDKHIPDVYLRASIEQRRALLAGLMDTDGWITAGASGAGRGAGAAKCELTLTCKPLVDGAVELIRSLGIKVQVTESDAKLYGRVVGRRWRMHFQAPENPFSCSRKADRWIPPRTARASLRYITAVEPVEPTPMRCIQVDSPDSTYLAGREMIPTHNSMMIRQLCVCAAAGLHPFRNTAVLPRRVLMVDCENNEAKSKKHILPMLRLVANLGYPTEGRLRITLHPEGLDLTKPGDAAWLLNRMDVDQPELLALGPLYNLHRVDLSDEVNARALSSVMNAARLRGKGCALISETHAGHGDSGNRSLRPKGSQLWRAWPDLIRAIRPLEKNPEFASFEKAGRGDRDQRYWPEYLRWGTRHGGEWVTMPWVECDEGEYERAAKGLVVA